MGVSGIRLRNLQVLLISLGFISLTILFTLHGLSTPGLLLGPNPVVGVAVQISFLLLGIFLWLATIPSDNRFITFLGRRNRLVLTGWTATLIVTSAIFFYNPSLVAWIPLNSTPLNWIVASITFLLASIASYRFWRAYRYTQFPIQSGLAHASILVATAQLIASTGQLWHISWWLYHFLLLLAVLITVFSLTNQFSFGDTIGLALQGLFTDNPTARILAGISPKVQALITAAEAHDTYTAGHAERVALTAIRLGEEVGLSPEELRALAQGSLLHDIGKISVPNEFLNKPATLTPEERSEMENHPIYGYEICKKLGFMQAELEIIRWHHERLNGRGYPDSIPGTSVPAMDQIMAIADVYDALTSDRAYRPAMTKDRAIRHLESFSGFYLSEDLVHLWKEMLKQEPDRSSVPS
jgi:putative nucleotidyltransferase with HDIG domain